MRDITDKIITLRTAKAQAIVFCKAATLELIKEKKIPKGDILEFARAAGYFGAKKTADLIPHCHPIGIDSLEFTFDFLTESNYLHYTASSSFRSGIVVLCEAKYIGRTGIEIEAITSVSIAALTIYDILKPLDDNLEVSSIRVVEKTGGRSGQRYFRTPPSCAVIVCSDSTFEGKREDKSGKLVQKMLQDYEARVNEYIILPDEKDAIQKKILDLVEKDVQFIFTTGGSGLGPRDTTVDAVKEIIERDADGITEAMRNYGQMRSPLAMMSRGVAGSIKHTTIVTLPGSSDGARESMEAILPAVFHARKMLKGGGH
ncbi:MAG: bifunctional molybdenum cofactor biosynthesis protein MoaC/MoaB [Ignavibacteriaceae bacterium]